MEMLNSSVKFIKKLNLFNKKKKQLILYVFYASMFVQSLKMEVKSKLIQLK